MLMWFGLRRIGAAGAAVRMDRALEVVQEPGVGCGIWRFRTVHVVICLNARESGDAGVGHILDSVMFQCTPPYAPLVLSY